MQVEVRLEREERKSLILLNVNLTKRVHGLDDALQENRKEKEKEVMQRKEMEKETEEMLLYKGRFNK